MAATPFDDALTETVHARFAGTGGSVEGSLNWIVRRLGGEPDPDRTEVLLLS